MCVCACIREIDYYIGIDWKGAHQEWNLERGCQTDGLEHSGLHYVLVESRTFKLAFIEQTRRVPKPDCVFNSN